MKGIILAGGSGTRLHPLTKVTSKQLLPVYNKPMIYYPLSTLMLANIKEILIISTPQDIPNFQQLLGDGSQLGMSLTYAEQPNPNGLPEAFTIGSSFIGDDDVTLILGDNIFYGDGMIRSLIRAHQAVRNHQADAVVFGYRVADPSRFGVIEFDADQQVRSIVEKPTHPVSKYAATGLYVYNNSVITRAGQLHPSSRGETEITDLNMSYVNDGSLQVELLGRGIAWLDTGTHASLLEASAFVETIERRQGQKIACLEEVAYRMGWISSTQLRELAAQYGQHEFHEYLLEFIQEIQP